MTRLEAAVDLARIRLVGGARRRLPYVAALYGMVTGRSVNLQGDPNASLHMHDKPVDRAYAAVRHCDQRRRVTPKAWARFMNSARNGGENVG